MATEKPRPTKAEFLEALNKNGINTLEELVDALLPETGGYVDRYTDHELSAPALPTILKGFSLCITDERWVT